MKKWQFQYSKTNLQLDIWEKSSKSFCKFFYWKCLHKNAVSWLKYKLWSCPYFYSKNIKSWKCLTSPAKTCPNYFWWLLLNNLVGYKMVSFHFLHSPTCGIHLCVFTTYQAWDYLNNILKLKLHYKIFFVVKVYKFF